MNIRDLLIIQSLWKLYNSEDGHLFNGMRASATTIGNYVNESRRTIRRIRATYKLPFYSDISSAVWNDNLLHFARDLDALVVSFYDAVPEANMTWSKELILETLSHVDKMLNNLDRGSRTLNPHWDKVKNLYKLRRSLVRRLRDLPEVKHARSKILEQQHKSIKENVL